VYFLRPKLIDARPDRESFAGHFWNFFAHCKKIDLLSECL
jgi:hypothetical protein